LSCKAPLSKPGSRCSVCGWAVDCHPEITRREREVALGLSLTATGIFLAIACAIVYEMVQ